MAFMGIDIQPYMPVKLLLSSEAHIKVMAVSLEVANAILSSPLCADPMLPLGATLIIFKATFDSPSVAPKNKGQFAEAGNYLVKWLATVAILVGKSTPTVAALYDAIPCGEGGNQRGPG